MCPAEKRNDEMSFFGAVPVSNPNDALRGAKATIDDTEDVCTYVNKLRK